ncbi:DUF4365 domain-containing protein [Streptomyces sp. WAC05950]|uniref:DUF4365 domain-containing protein n=1 Tax=unclassified Streptomyces TaxID=2593676 RepID=UPI000F73E0EB|nr:DUF4365 domain-containing protein [Streptomyces sp. WAC05950]RST14259.1 DUF4365 domain-containing protein [Streptomyces sp. WAC05950]
MARVLPTKKTERAGVNEFRALLEAAGHIVQEIDGGNDYGEDCYLSFTRSGERTGDIVAVQVKSGTAYRRAVGYGISCREHLHDWTRSRIPVIGVVYDPDLKKLFWANLTQYLLDELEQGRTPKSVPVGETAVLDADTVASVVLRIRRFIEENDRVRPIELGLGQSLVRKANRLRGRHSNDVDRTPVGGLPYEMAVPAVDFHERHPRVGPAVKRGLLTTVILCCLAMLGPGLYGAVESNGHYSWPFSGWMWLVSYYGTVLCLLAASSLDPQRKRARLLRWWAFALVWSGWYVGMAHQTSAWTAQPVFEWIFVVQTPVLAKFLLCFLGGRYVYEEMSRRRRLKAAYPDGLPEGA